MRELAKVCPVCQSKFTTWNYTARMKRLYCSNKCKQKAYRHRNLIGKRYRTMRLASANRNTNAQEQSE